MSSSGINLLAAKLTAVGEPRTADVPPAAILAETADAEQQRQALAEPSPEQIRFAGIIEQGARLGLLCLFITFPLYVFGIVEPQIPIDKVCEYWKLDVHEYRSAVALETGWGWVSMLGHGDFLNFVGIIILASTTVLSYLAVIPLLFKRREFVYLVLAVLQVLVLVFAASGVVSMGH